MSLEGLFQAYADGPLGRTLKESTWSFAITEVVHLLALAVLGGVVLVAAAASLGLGSRRRPIRATVEGLRGVFLVSLAAMLASGAVLVGTNPMKYYFNDAFRVKMLLLVLAIAAFGGLTLGARRAGAGRASAVLRIAAVLSLVLWFGVGLSGRLIGLL